jgi:hypothetical protein
VSLKRTLSLNLKNIPGWRTSRKILVIESDDWGSNRMPSKEAYDSLEKAGVKVQSYLNKYDTIERKEDLEALYEVLYSVKDKNGKPAVITPFMNVANPDFEKIKASGFNEYHYETFLDTAARYGSRADFEKLYANGLAEGIFVPEFHSREHLTVQPWMKLLRDCDKDVTTGFDHHYYSVPTPNIKPAMLSGFRPAFYMGSASELPFLRNSIYEGVDLFKKIFNHAPSVFDAPNGICPIELEKDLAAVGIVSLGVQRKRKVPNGQGGFNNISHSFGQKNEHGQRYYIRNCQFEPWDGGGADYSLAMIKAAFRWGKPAIISSHRVNFAGGIDVANREKSLRELKKLLTTVRKNWPDVEFMSSASLASLMHQK